MRHPYFVKAIQTAYERLIPEGRQVPFFLKFEVAAERIDVNIHPTKTEIKFEDDAAIFQILLAAVRESLGKFGAVPAIDFDRENSPEIPPLNENSFSDFAPSQPRIHINPNFNPFSPDSDNTGEQSFGREGGKQIDWRKLFEESQTDAELSASSIGRPDFTASKVSETDFTAPDFPDFTEEERKDEDAPLFAPLSFEERPMPFTTSEEDYIQYRGQYIVTPMNGGLTLIDQHRAHVRILFERFLQRSKEKAVPSQRLLFPEMLTLSPSESNVLDELSPALHAVGFDISPLGGGCYSLLSVPTGTEGLSPLPLVESIINDAKEGHADAEDTVNRIVALSLARKAAMPVGQALGREEMVEIVRMLFLTESPSLTPDGKPILRTFHPEEAF